MKKAQLIAYEDIKGVRHEDLKYLDAIFKSPTECFEDNASDEEILEFFETKYATQIKTLFDAKLKVCFV